MTLTAMAGESEGSGAEDKPGGEAANRGAPSDATSKDADAAGAGGRHESGKMESERVAGRQENLSGESSGVRDGEGGPETSRGPKTLGGIAREWEGESSHRGALTPPELKSCPGGTKPPE